MKFIFLLFLWLHTFNLYAQISDATPNEQINIGFLGTDKSKITDEFSENWQSEQIDFNFNDKSLILQETYHPVMKDDNHPEYMENIRANAQEKCDSNDGYACARLAYTYAEEFGESEQDYKKAIELYEKACRLNDNYGCINMANFYAHGKWVKQDYNKVADYYQKTCLLQLGEGCFMLGNLYQSGKKNIKQDFAKAEEYYKKSCDLKYGDGCANLGYLFIHNKTKQSSKILEYYEKSCEYNSSAGCFSLAVLYETGKFFQKDNARSRELYIKSCDLTDGRACFYLANLYFSDESKSKEYYKKSCENKYFAGCAMKKILDEAKN